MKLVYCFEAVSWNALLAELTKHTSDASHIVCGLSQQGPISMEHTVGLTKETNSDEKSKT